ncbi:RNA pseudouridylate synthase domain-containing protein 2 isoform X2 [Sturnira hondurensis]|uniref:RNA pseudouridylate synthase domain-containing protein 2 isoform X2 n=1 Tax=Sturnira hondurensis TaxID=192404 RepID=UPI001879DB3E|nr:RNA pseudouridylate synthase domain-containing protein 2 isoform X2 [Sturnira hondurensis]
MSTLQRPATTSRAACAKCGLTTLTSEPTAKAVGWATACCTSSAPSSEPSPCPTTKLRSEQGVCTSTRSQYRTSALCSRKLCVKLTDDRLLASWLTNCLCCWQDNDFLRNTVHRHEPPVTAEPVRLLAENEDVVVVDKPSSIPVHPCGRFRHNTVIFILGKEHQLKELHPLHRLDRLTSGVLMFAKTAAVSERIHEQVRDRQLEKEYVCRVEGEFPAEEVTCKEPILVVSYKVGVCRVDPQGKPCETVFQRLSYNGHSSVVRCRPLTGRTHQIRVHLQFLGHPILNDPIYNSVAWGPSRGRGGHIPKTDEELLQDLVAEHQAKQSLDVIDLCEGDLSSALTDSTAPSSELGKDYLEGLVASAQKMDGILEAAPQDLDTKALAPGNAAEKDVVNQEIDPLCAECRLVRQDPLPQDLVMFLHALCYKGPGFEYSSPMPAWAQDDWKEN